MPEVAGVGTDDEVRSTVAMLGWMMKSGGRVLSKPAQFDIKSTAICDARGSVACMLAHDFAWLVPPPVRR
jgi:hypothetical protein